MKAELVSVVIPVRNGAKTVRSSLESVLSQDYPAFELIVVLAPSTDGSEDIIADYPHVRVVAQRSTGIVGGFNEGIESAQGDFIAFNGADDLWLPDKLSEQMAIFSERPQTQVVTCLMEFFFDGEAPPAGFRPHLVRGAHVGNNCETMLARTALFAEIGRFDPEFDVAFDVEFFSRVADSGIDHVVVPKTLVRKRVHDGAHHIAYGWRNNKQLLSIAARSMARKRGER